MYFTQDFIILNQKFGVVSFFETSVVFPEGARLSESESHLSPPHNHFPVLS